MPRRCGLSAMLVLVVLGSSALAQEPPGAYERLDPGKLAQRLSSLGMGELLNAYVDELRLSGAGSVEQQLIVANSKIAQASGQADLGARNKLLDQAVETLRNVVKLTEDAEKPKELLKHYEYRLQLAQTLGLVYTEPNYRNLLYLQGGQADKDMILEKTAEADRIMRSLESTVRTKLESWRPNYRLLVTVVPRLEDLQNQLRYRAAWMRLYRAMAMPATADYVNRRATLLRQAKGALLDYAEGDNEENVKYPALRGCALVARTWAEHQPVERERDRLHQEADAYLKEIISAGPDTAGADNVVLALFERARNLVEWGKFEQAKAAVDEFERLSKEILHERAQLQSDVKTAMLTNYLYEQWAESVSGSNPELAKKYRLQAQQAFLDFIKKYDDPGIQAAFFSIIASKYRQREDYENLNAMILLAIAISESVKEDQASINKTHDLLEMVLDRDTDLAKLLRPTAMWQMGLVLNTMGETRRSGKTFLELARKHPDYETAGEAALFSVRLYSREIDSYKAERKAVPGELQDEYITALKTLLQNPGWGKDEEAVGWNFELGQACMAKAKTVSEPDDVLKWIQEAIDAYDRLPPSEESYMYGRFLALEARVDRQINERLREAGISDSPAVLVRDLRAYARDARKAAAEETDPDMKDALLAWGARCDFSVAVVYYEVMNQPNLAKEMLKRIPNDWPGTPVLQEVTDYQIRKLIETGQTREAITEIEKFGEEHPDKAEDLISLVVAQIRERIDDLGDRPEKTRELIQYQVAYHRFAETLFQEAKDQELSERYALTQMYADSLVQAGLAALENAGNSEAELHFQSALNYFTKCKEYDEQRRSRRAQGYDEHFDKVVKAIDAAKNDPDAIKKIAADLLDELKDLGAGPRRSSAVSRLQVALDYLDRPSEDQSAPSAEERPRRLSSVVENLRKAVEFARRRAKQSIPVDMSNVLGLARANRYLGNEDEARRLYREMISGVDASAHAETYWDLQVEYARFLLNSYKGDSEMMSALVTRIKQLRLADPSLYSTKVRGALNYIQAEAERLSR